jgi:hypothetical protein
MTYAPVCVFAYKRLESLKKVISQLQMNYLAPSSELFVCSNAPIKEEENEVVNNIREYASNITGFKNVTLIINPINKGGSEHATKRITDIITEYKKIISLSDDDVPTRNFLNYMNDALRYYENNKKIFSIGAYTFPIPEKFFGNDDICFIPRPCTWGWGIWVDRWMEAIKCEIVPDEIRKLNWFHYNQGGYDLFHTSMTGMFDDAGMDAKLIYTMYVNKLLTIYPKKSFITNIGFDGIGSHTHPEEKDRYMPLLVNQEKVNFNFTDRILINKDILRCYRRKCNGFYYYLLDRFPSILHFLRRLKRFSRKILDIKAV